MPNVLNSIFGGSQKPDFAEATQRLMQALSDSEAADETIQNSIKSFYDVLPKATEAELSEAIESLADLFFLLEESKSTVAMMICGNLMERGFYSATVSSRMIEKMAYLTDSAYPFFVTFQSELAKRGESEDDPEGFELLDSLKDALWDDLADAIISWNTLEDQYVPAVSMFSIDAAVRNKAKETVKHIQYLAEYNQGCLWLNKLFCVLFDEPILVIEPENNLGFIGKMSGIEDNFQLQGLLMDVFPRTDAVQPRISKKHANVFEGIGPQAQEGSITGAWNMCNWQAVNYDFSLSTDNSQHWIWSEGTPADISIFAGFRVVLLGKPSYARNISLQRTFSHLKASIRVEKELAQDEIESWLSRMLHEKNNF